MPEFWEHLFLAPLPKQLYNDTRTLGACWAPTPDPGHPQNLDHLSGQTMDPRTWAGFWPCLTSSLLKPCESHGVTHIDVDDHHVSDVVSLHVKHHVTLSTPMTFGTLTVTLCESHIKRCYGVYLDR